MLIVNTSSLTGKLHIRDLPVTVAQLQAWHRSGCLIQDVFPQLTRDQREFLLTGATAEEWEQCSQTPADRTGYPMHAYVYDLAGRHGRARVIADRDALHTFLIITGVACLHTRQEVRITSPDDEAVYFHIEGGHIVYASGVPPALYEDVLRTMAQRRQA